MALPGQSECEVLGRLLGIAEVSVPVLGFGSTDCRRCPSHLLDVDRAIPSALSECLVVG
jgi:Uri superfamily endonuclease